jgi:hypothetical protein
MPSSTISMTIPDGAAVAVTATVSPRLWSMALFTISVNA